MKSSAQQCYDSIATPLKLTSEAILEEFHPLYEHVISPPPEIIVADNIKELISKIRSVYKQQPDYDYYIEIAPTLDQNEKKYCVRPISLLSPSANLFAQDSAKSLAVKQTFREEISERLNALERVKTGVNLQKTRKKISISASDK